MLVALVTLANLMLEALPLVEGRPITLQRVLGTLLAPLAWLVGVPWSEAPAAGALLGTKTVLNEFIAYLDLAHLPDGALSLRSRLLMTYALCGFANFGSLGILIGGLATMAPERRDEIVGLGMKSIVAGTLATCMTGAVVGMLWVTKITSHRGRLSTVGTENSQNHKSKSRRLLICFSSVSSVSSVANVFRFCYTT